MSNRYVLTAIMASTAFIISAPALAQASNEVLQSRTSDALDLDVGQFEISEVSKSGVRTDYVATTKSGDRYKCYVTSSSGLTKLMTGGENASDAMCRKRGQPAQSNALLDAAAKQGL